MAGGRLVGQQHRANALKILATRLKQVEYRLVASSAVAFVFKGLVFASSAARDTCVIIFTLKCGKGKPVPCRISGLGNS
jgi:hypothetical protein